MLKIINAALVIIVLFFYGCVEYDKTTKDDLSSPEATIEALYKAHELSDFEKFKKVFIDTAWIKKDEFLKVSSKLTGYRIVRQQTMGKGLFSEEGDVHILVEERYASGNKTELMNYILRKSNNKWLIASFNADEEKPIDTKVIEKQSRVFRK